MTNNKVETAKQNALKTINAHISLAQSGIKYSLPEVTERSLERINRIKSRFFKKHGVEL